MIFFANFLLAVSRILHIILIIYIWMVIFRAILSWVRVPALYPVAVVLFHLTEPILKPVRIWVPPRKLGGVDISPVIVVLALLFVDSFLVKSLSLYADQLLRQQLLFR
jgi:YggT family protein